MMHTEPMSEHTQQPCQSAPGISKCMQNPFHTAVRIHVMICPRAMTGCIQSPCRDSFRSNVTTHRESVTECAQDACQTALTNHLRMHAGSMSLCSQCPFQNSFRSHASVLECFQKSRQNSHLDTLRLHVRMHTKSIMECNPIQDSCEHVVRIHVRMHTESMSYCTQSDTQN